METERQDFSTEEVCIIRIEETKTGIFQNRSELDFYREVRTSDRPQVMADEFIPGTISEEQDREVKGLSAIEFGTTSFQTHYEIQGDENSSLTLAYASQAPIRFAQPTPRPPWA